MLQQVLRLPYPISLNSFIHSFYTVLLRFYYDKSVRCYGNRRVDKAEVGLEA